MKGFDQRYAEALADDNLGPSLLSFQRAWRDVRDGQIAELESTLAEDFAGLRSRLAEVKAAVRGDLAGYLERFCAAAEDAGATVMHAADAAEARSIVAAICEEAGTSLIVKGKSMLSEEIFLNDSLAAEGVTAVETDLGEWILQLAGEHPTHLVMPAIHKRRHDVAALLERVLGRPFDPEDIPTMVATARTELRDAFLSAGVGLTGANALIASTGTVMLVCNEGNNRMATTLPGVHLVLAGIDKLIPDHEAAALQIRLLARSATGQRITTYTNFVTGPRAGQRQYIVIVDNGRTEMASDPEFASALACIRCGACANVCPPYQVVGGQGFGHVYAGAIGLVNTRFHHDLEDIAGPQSLCVSCGACTQVCPVEIPLADQILSIRRAVVESGHADKRERVISAIFRSRAVFATLTRLAAVVTWPLRRGRVAMLRLPSRYFRWRLPPAVALRPARSRIRDVPIPSDGPQVTLFLQCISDRIDPGPAVATAKLVAAAGERPVVPRKQHCCGLPAFDAGDWETARRLARQTIAVLEREDPVVTPGASCVVAVRQHYPRLFADDPQWLQRARDLGSRMRTVVEYVDERQEKLAAVVGRASGRTAVHRFCQSSNVLGQGELAERVLAGVAGVTPVELAEAEVCCGFGGSTSLVAPEVSAGVLERKLACVDGSGAQTLVTDNPGCVLHLRGGAAASGRDLRVLHVAELLANQLPG